MHFSGRTWRPPYERLTPIVEATSGCAWGRCSFCDLYRFERFSITPIERFCEDLDEVKRMIPYTRRLWLTGGSPFQIGYARLEEMALAVRDRLVKMQAIAMFASVRDVKRYTDDELRRLSLLRVGGLTIGMESADDRALEIGGKGYASADVREQCLRLEAAGMEYSLIYMTGLAGAGRGVDAARSSLEVINDLRPRFIGVGSLTLFEGTRLHESAREGRFEPPPEMERVSELVELIKGIRFRTFLDARSASNAVPVAGMLPYDRGRMLAQVEHALESEDEETMRAFRRSITGL